ncbi:acyl-CoA dehydrogenase family protein [Dyella sp.]|jgi:acyl-CoA dehydrogenase|uniref:acyl-CoA dehydrogenase family protein n=1 Tax=Dyella sp. TaxID=1869338 RepID=UPI002D7A15C1|nr:acyl-CoA dehydrogenase family protein [Dyella sp.]HET6431957.1 acyl-CoA dehydrogenase family protein [Dyella sp.]
MTTRSAIKKSALLSRTAAIASEVAAVHAGDVDKRSRFPHETIDALRQAGLLSAAVPEAYGGAGAGMLELGAQCAALAQGCSSSGMVLAMHHIQVACMARHAQGSPFFERYMRESLVERQALVASITSENGTFGDTRSSICAVQIDGDRMSLEKDATTVSYGQHADAQLVTCRRTADAAASDQLLVLFDRDSYTLAQSGEWDTLGMRGTCSPGAKFSGHGSIEQIIPGSYADASAQTMVPYSHILWAALWSGIAADALGRAAAFVRAGARKNPGSVPPNAVQLARAQVELQAMRHNWESCAIEFDEMTAENDAAAREALNTMGWALRLNQLKIACSEMAPKLCHEALQIIGIMGYKNDSPFSVGRHYRDVLSAALMVSNGRIAAKNASMLLVFKDE